jgi:hypothetical protein
MHLHSLLILGAFSYSALALQAGSLLETSGLSPRQARDCIISGWIPVCPGPSPFLPPVTSLTYPGALPCIPPSGTCCTGGYYHLPGGRCPNGQSEVPRIGQSQSAPPPASITPAPTPIPLPSPVVQYTWYTYTITYYYFYYYYYYFAATYQLTSTRTTYFSTLSLTATNEVAANSAFEVLSKTLTFVTPTQAGTPTLGSVAPPTSTPVVSSAPLRPTTSSKAGDASPSRNVTVPSVSTPPQFTGGAVGVRFGGNFIAGQRFGVMLGSLAVVPGVLMLLL